MRSFTQLLQKPIDASTLGLYRILFGILMFVEVIRYFAFGKTREPYLKPKFLFTFEWVEFLRPWPNWGMTLFFVLLGLFALGILLGFFYRLSCLGFFFFYTYLFLLEKSDYNNHYYLMSLLSFLFFVTDAHHWGSLDRKRKPTLSAWVPFWQLFLFRFQFFIVYFYGGIAKLNFDWFRGSPLKPWLSLFQEVPLVGPVLTHPWSLYFLCYGGLLFDLSIGFLLLWKSARKLCVAMLLFFHLTNSWLFSIGIFPWLAFFSTLVFFEPEWARMFFKQTPLKTLPANTPPASRCLFILISAYLLFQLLFPLRHWLYTGDVNWTEEGHRFSWRMKLRDKVSGVYFASYWSNTEHQYRWNLEIQPQGTVVEKIERISRGNTQVLEQNQYSSITPQQIEQRLTDLGQKPFMDILPYQTIPIRFYVTDTKTNQRWQHPIERDLAWSQIQKMAAIPEMILQYAHYLKRHYEKNGVNSPKIQAHSGCSLNGRPFYPLVDPQTNLSEETNSFWRSSRWILPLPESKPKWEFVIEIVLLFLAFCVLIGFFFRYVKRYVSH